MRRPRAAGTASAASSRPASVLIFRDGGVAHDTRWLIIRSSLRLGWQQPLETARLCRCPHHRPRAMAPSGHPPRQMS